MAPPTRSAAHKEEEQKAVLGALIDEFVQQGVQPRVPILKHTGRINQDAIYDRPHGAHTWRDRLLFVVLHVVNEVRAAQGFKLLDDGREFDPASGTSEKAARVVADYVLKPLAELAEAASFAELAAAHGLAVPEIYETRRNAVGFKENMLRTPPKRGAAGPSAAARSPLGDAGQRAEERARPPATRLAEVREAAVQALLDAGCVTELEAVGGLLSSAVIISLLVGHRRAAGSIDDSIWACVAVRAARWWAREGRWEGVRGVAPARRLCAPAACRTR